MRRVAALVVVALLVGAAWLGRGALLDGAPTSHRTAAGSSGTPAEAGHVRVSRPAPGRVLARLGVASYNAYRHLPLDAARRGWDRITADPRVDLIGW